MPPMHILNNRLLELRSATMWSQRVTKIKLVSLQQKIIILNVLKETTILKSMQ